MKRIQELDALRAAGSLLIVAFHIFGYEFFFGWSRVDLFFVLSGYLVTLGLVKGLGRGDCLGRFYVRRAVRIWPTYYAVLLAVTASELPVMSRERGWGLLSAAFFAQNVPFYRPGGSSGLPHTLIHTWSLAIEQQFYFLWPFLLGLCGRRRLIPVLAAIAVGSVALRSAGLHPWTFAARCDGLAIGSLLALVLDDPARARRFGFRAAWAVTGLCAANYLGWYLTSAGLPEAFDSMLGPKGSLAVLAANVLYADVIALLVVSSGRPALAPLRAGPVRYLGQVSYGIYLYSIPAIEVTQWVLQSPSSASFTTGMTALFVTVVTAVVSWELIERPLAGVKDRWGRRPSGTSEVAPPPPCGARLEAVDPPTDLVRSG